MVGGVHVGVVNAGHESNFVCEIMTDKTTQTPYEYSDEFESDFKWLMKNVRGRRLVHWLLARAGVFRTTFEEAPIRAPYMAIAMAHAEGRKDMGYRLMGVIGRLCPNLYGKMMEENRNGRAEQRSAD